MSSARKQACELAPDDPIALAAALLQSGPIEQADAEAFALEATGAIVGRFGGDIGRDARHAVSRLLATPDPHLGRPGVGQDIADRFLKNAQHVEGIGRVKPRQRPALLDLPAAVLQRGVAAARAALVAGWLRPSASPARPTLQWRAMASNTTSRFRSTFRISMAWIL